MSPRTQRETRVVQAENNNNNKWEPQTETYSKRASWSWAGLGVRSTAGGSLTHSTQRDALSHNKPPRARQQAALLLETTHCFVLLPSRWVVWTELEAKGFKIFSSSHRAPVSHTLTVSLLQDHITITGSLANTRSSTFNIRHCWAIAKTDSD